MNNINYLGQHVGTVYGRLTALYQSADASPLAPELLPIALKELGVAAEELQVALEELTRQNEELAIAQTRTETERQRYQNLFEFASDAYLITDIVGNIREANRTAAALLQRRRQFLIHKPLSSLIAFANRQRFRAKLTQLTQRDRLGLTLRMHRSSAEQFDAALTVNVIRSLYDG